MKPAEFMNYADGRLWVQVYADVRPEPGDRVRYRNRRSNRTNTVTIAEPIHAYAPVTGWNGKVLTTEWRCSLAPRGTSNVRGIRT